MDTEIEVSVRDRFLLYLQRIGFEVEFGFRDNGISMVWPDGSAAGDQWWEVDTTVTTLSKGGEILGEIDSDMKLRTRADDDSPAVKEAIRAMANWHPGESEEVDAKALGLLRLTLAKCHIDAAGPSNIGKSHAASALPLYEEALSLDPTLARAWNGKGAALVTLERKDEGLKCYEKAIEIDPSLLVSWHNLGNRYAENNQPRRAHHAYAKAAGLEPDVPSDWILKASAMLKIGDYHGAVLCAEHALTLLPHNAWAATVLKDAKARLGSDVSAR